MKNYQLYTELDILEKEIEEQEFILTAEEEEALKEITQLKEDIKGIDVMKGFGEVALKGVEDYINTFIDTSEIMDDLKTPGAAIVDNKTIGRHVTANPDDTNRTRKMYAAEKSPYPAGSKQDYSQLSEYTQKRIKMYEQAYHDRTKTVIPHHHTQKDNVNNDITLAGLKSYQFGPTVPIYTSEQYKQMYNEAGQRDNIANWIRDKNFTKYRSEAYRDFGFSSPSEFGKWIDDNHLSIHETPNGMYLVPEDVHNAERHKGEVSVIKEYLEGKTSKENMDQYERKEKVRGLVYDGVVRVGRITSSAAMVIVKTFAQKASSIIVTEVYKEFKVKTEITFGERIKRIVLKCIERFKKELKEIKDLIVKQLKGSALNEILTLINDVLISYLSKTIKNIFKVIRQMIGSIIQAFKILISKEYSWSDKFYEASKILSAGLVAVLGYSLNTILEQLFQKIPVINAAASFLADMFSGLFACILSALVLQLFDSYKQKLILSDKQLQLQLQNNKFMEIEVNIAGLDTLKTNAHVIKTALLIDEQIAMMRTLGGQIDSEIDKSTIIIEQIRAKRKNLN